MNVDQPSVASMFVNTTENSENEDMDINEKVDWKDPVVKKMKGWKTATEPDGTLKWPWLECRSVFCFQL